MPDKSFSMVFVCQAGRLEVDAVMLALSLRHFAAGDYELVAAVPTPAHQWGAPRPETLQALERLGARIAPIENQIDPAYPIGNKVSCLSIPTTSDQVVFLDSDVLCLRPLDLGSTFGAEFSAKPADRATAGLSEEVWRHAYAAAGLEPPAARMVSTVSGERMYPYYNAGVVSVRSDAGLGEAWLRCCLAIDADPRVAPKRPWLDQIALPVAVQQLGLRAVPLSERHNFPAHLRRVDDDDPPVLCHYHHPRFLARSRAAAGTVLSLAAEHPFAWGLMAMHPDWERVARLGRPKLRQRLASARPARRVRALAGRRLEAWHRGRLTAAERTRTAIVTGMPRSGTSLFCALLSSLPNAVCLNEVGSPARPVQTMRTLRARIAAGRPVPNKHGPSGAPTTDTMAGGTRRSMAVVPVEDDDFVLALKWTLPYLNRIHELCDEGFAVWVLVRHPAFTIASWRRSPAEFGIAQLDPPAPQLAGVPFTSSDPDQRRVDVWNHYARLVHSLRERVAIVRYEDLVSDPHSELRRFRAHFGLAPAPETPVLTSRNVPADIEPGIADLVARHCDLELFGYS